MRIARNTPIKPFLPLKTRRKLSANIVRNVNDEAAEIFIMWPAVGPFISSNAIKHIDHDKRCIISFLARTAVYIRYTRTHTVCVPFNGNTKRVITSLRCYGQKSILRMDFLNFRRDEHLKVAGMKSEIFKMETRSFYLDAMIDEHLDKLSRYTSLRCGVWTRIENSA